MSFLAGLFGDQLKMAALPLPGVLRAPAFDAIDKLTKARKRSGDSTSDFVRASITPAIFADQFKELP